MRFPVRFVEMYEDLFMEGKTLPKRLGNAKDFTVKMEYDTELELLIVNYKGTHTLVPKTSCKQIVPANAADLGLKVQPAIDQGKNIVDPALTAHIQTHMVGAQIEDPTKPARGRKTQ